MQNLITAKYSSFTVYYYFLCACGAAATYYQDWEKEQFLKNKTTKHPFLGKKNPVFFN